MACRSWIAFILSWIERNPLQTHPNSPKPTATRRCISGMACAWARNSATAIIRQCWPSSPNRIAATSSGVIRPAKNTDCRAASIIDGHTRRHSNRPGPNRSPNSSSTSRRTQPSAVSSPSRPPPRQIPHPSPRQAGLVIAQIGQQVRTLHQHHLGPDEIHPFALLLQTAKLTGPAPVTKFDRNLLLLTLLQRQLNDGGSNKCHSSLRISSKFRSNRPAW